MTTQTLAAPVPPGRRGRLEIADRVIARIAGQAAREVREAAGRSGGVLGVGGHSDFDAVPDVTVRLHGTDATISIALGVAFPLSVREAAAGIRRHVTERVEHLCGVTVQRVDITVTALVPRNREAALT